MMGPRVTDSDGARDVKGHLMDAARKYPEKPEAVYFFGTCLVDLFYPEAGLAGIELLRREGIRVIYPPGQTCCGQPSYNSGYPDEAREVARRMADLFPRDYPIVVPSGSCAAMMRRHYPRLFSEDPLRARIEALVDRVYELTEFLVHVVKVNLVDRGGPVRVTWHASCHALRDMGIDAEPRRLLEQLESVEIAPLAGERECCGFGGTFSVKQSAISAEMVRDKVDDIERSGAAVVLSTDCGCLMNIEGALEHTGRTVRARHVAEFLWERTHGPTA